MLRNHGEKLFEKIEHIALNFTAYGVPNFLRAKRLIHKLIWLMFIAACFSFACFFASSIMGIYLSYEKVTRTEKTTIDAQGNKIVEVTEETADGREPMKKISTIHLGK